MIITINGMINNVPPGVSGRVLAFRSDQYVNVPVTILVSDEPVEKIDGFASNVNYDNGS